jgi:hypothetical protein
MTTADCLKLAVIPTEVSETNDNSPNCADIQSELLHELIPSINAVKMISEMIEQETLGPIEMGPYKQYLLDLQECAETQNLFARKLTEYLRNS